MATAKSYLTLINDAIRESGTDLDSLLSADFSDPPDKMHAKFKDWVRQAWLEEQMIRRHSHLLGKRASIIIRPRYYVEQVSGKTGNPGSVADRVYIGDDTTNLFHVLSVDLISGAWASGTAKANIDYESLSGPLKINEYIDLYASDETTLIEDNNAQIKGWGRYNLQSIVSDLLEPQVETFFIGSTGGSSTQDNDSNTGLAPLRFISWETYREVAETGSYNFGCPQYFSVMPDGTYDFLPRPDKEYVVYFEYQAEPQDLSASSDTLTGLPPEYQDIVTWKTVMFYADYDKKPQMYARARKRYLFYKKMVDQTLLPPVTWRPSVYRFSE